MPLTNSPTNTYPFVRMIEYVAGARSSWSITISVNPTGRPLSRPVPVMVIMRPPSAGLYAAESTDDDHEGHHFKSTSVDSAAYNPADGGRMLTMTGTGLDNGLPVGFTLIVVDLDDVAPATYSIILTNGYVFVGEFVSGIVNVQ